MAKQLSGLTTPWTATCGNGEQAVDPGFQPGEESDRGDVRVMADVAIDVRSGDRITVAAVRRLQRVCLKRARQTQRI